MVEARESFMERRKATKRDELACSEKADTALDRARIQGVRETGLDHPHLGMRAQGSTSERTASLPDGAGPGTHWHSHQ